MKKFLFSLLFLVGCLWLIPAETSAQFTPPDDEEVVSVRYSLAQRIRDILIESVERIRTRGSLQ